MQLGAPKLRGRDRTKVELRRAGRHVAVALGVASCLLLWACSAGARSDEQANAHAKVSRRFPLQHEVPSRYFAVLREGDFHGTQWGAYIYADGAGDDSSQRPCLFLARITAGGIFGDVEKCGALAPAEGSGGIPVYALLGRSEYIGKRAIEETVLAATFAPSVVKVRLQVEPGKAIVRHTSILDKPRQRKGRVAPLRYMALAVSRDICVKRITGYDRTGRVIVNADTTECPLG